MKILFKKSYFRDVKKTRFNLLTDLDILIESLKSANSLASISHLKKMKGATSAYRIQLDDHRLCFFYQDEIITIARFLPRKNVYNYFP